MTAVLIPSPDEYKLAEQTALIKRLRDNVAANPKGGAGMAGNVYMVGNQWGNVAQDLGAAFMQGKNRMDNEDAYNRQQQAEQDFLSQMPSPTEVAPQFGPTQDGGNLPDVVRDKDPQALAQATAAWAARAPATMPGVRDFALQQTMLAPEKAAARKDAAQLRMDQIRYQEQERKDRQQAQIAADLQRAQETNTARALIASMRRVGGGSGSGKMRIINTVDENGNPTQMVVDMNSVKPGDTFGKAPTAKEMEAANKKTEALDKLMRARELLKDNPDAVGLKTLVPDLFLQRMDPSGTMTRASIGEVGAEKAHALYGAAFSASEQRRANKFIPADGDDAATIQSKLDNLIELATHGEAGLDAKIARDSKGKGGRPSPAPAATPKVRVYNRVTGTFE